jgi:predicted PurR-regulated permease PerM
MPANTDAARTAGIVILAVIAAVGALYLGADFLVPIALAFLLNILLRPLVREFERFRVPPAISAAIVVLGVLAIITMLGMTLTPPLKKWMNEAPQNLSRAEARLRRLREPVRKVTDVATQMEQTAVGPSTAPSAAPAPPPAAPVPPISLAGRVLGTSWQVIGGGIEIVMLLYLLLASGGMFFQKLMCVLDTSRDKKVARQIVAEAEAVVLRYMLVTAAINFVQAIVIALMMWKLGMPAPILWGLFTFAAEFIPYLGALAMIIALAISATATFEGLGHILAAPLSYLIVSTLQNNLVSPYAYGNHLKLNPPAVLIGVIFWWFVWGIPGAFLAVPILAMIVVIAKRSQRMQPLAEFLSE